MATILPILEKTSESKINSSEGYIWTKAIIGTVKGILMVSVFIINGLANDFYIALFFFSTSSIGMLYFYMNPCLEPMK
jgi:hypothetical protein